MQRAPGAHEARWRRSSARITRCWSPTSRWTRRCGATSVPPEAGLRRMWMAARIPARPARHRPAAVAAPLRAPDRREAAVRLADVPRGQRGAAQPPPRAALLAAARACVCAAGRAGAGVRRSAVAQRPNARRGRGARCTSSCIDTSLSMQQRRQLGARARSAPRELHRRACAARTAAMLVAADHRLRVLQEPVFASDAGALRAALADARARRIAAGLRQRWSARPPRWGAGPGERVVLHLRDRPAGVGQSAALRGPAAAARRHARPRRRGQPTAAANLRVADVARVASAATRARGAPRRRAAGDSGSRARA